ncbi:hypothetical protein [Ktedonosporobacter rubrisoli]|uniref:hypothetical protein n=1 Tax=Ktedonosporobacter rubrisoli TaxID=2509675 RepID=UPI001F5C20D8|nr:hypothetical protein [Ktedonosporobacter rubrisoli]
MSNRAAIAHFRTFDAEFFGLAVDAFTTGALRVNGCVKRGASIQEHALESSSLPIEIFDTALPFEKLWMVTGLTGESRKEQRALEVLAR